MTKRALAAVRKPGKEAREDLESPSSSDEELEDSFEKGARNQKNQDMVNVEFEFFDPKEEDFSGVKALLKSYTDGGEVDLNGLVDSVLAQTRVGTLVKIQGDDTVIGLATCLNLREHRDAAWMKDVRAFLERKVRGAPEEEREKVRALWAEEEREAGGRGGGGRTGWLLSERIRNVPWELAPHVFQGLLDEISWATEDEPTEELRQSFRFERYVLLTRVFRDQHHHPHNSAPASAKHQSKKQNRGQGTSASGDSSFIYLKPEDQAFHELSVWSLTFPVDAEALAPHQTKGVQELRLLMVMEAARVEAFKAKLKMVVARSVHGSRD